MVFMIADFLNLQGPNPSITVCIITRFIYAAYVKIT